MGLVAKLFKVGNAEKVVLLGKPTGGSLFVAKTLILVRLLGMIGKVGSCTIGRITVLLLFGTTPAPLPAYAQLEGRAALLSPTAYQGHSSSSLRALHPWAKAFTNSFCSGFRLVHGMRAFLQRGNLPSSPDTPCVQPIPWTA